MKDINIPLALSFDDVLLVPKYSDINSRSEVDLSTKISPNLTLKIPLISTKMDTVTGVEMAIAIGKLGGLGILPRFETIKSQIEKVKEVKSHGVVVAVAIGVKEDYMERAEALVEAGATVIDIDVAHGHMEKAIKVTKAIKDRFGDKITLMSGITSTQDCAEDLYKAGADCLLVGVGGGSICTTRVMTGFGVPVLQSLLETRETARKYNKTFLPDAGIRNSGDIVKALAAGASAIVAGNLFAGTKESPGEIVEIDGEMYKVYNGSASLEEKEKQVDIDPKDKSESYTKHIEGISGTVPYKGPLKGHIEGIIAGIRSGLSYAGAKNIEELWEKAEFIKVTNAGLKENHAHDVRQEK